MLAPAALRLVARGLLPAAASAGTPPASRTWRALCSSGGAPSAAASHEGGPPAAPAGPADAVHKEEGDTYFATPGEDGGSYAAAASRAPHPPGAADTSSMNAPEGQACPGDSSAAHSAARDAAIHHPGREQEVLGLNNKNVKSAGNSTTGSSGSSGTRRSFGSAAAGDGGGQDDSPGRLLGGEGAGSDSRPGQDSQADQQQPDVLEGGATGGIAGSWRAMTAAGGDDMTGGGSAGTVADDAAMAVNPDSGLPRMSDAADSGAGAAGFGKLRDPSQAPEEGGDVMMREGEKSTGQIPADTASG